MCNDLPSQHPFPHADPASGVSVRPVAASSLASAVPTPAIPGGASVAAANGDALAASQACLHSQPCPLLRVLGSLLVPCLCPSSCRSHPGPKALPSGRDVVGDLHGAHFVFCCFVLEM